MRYSRTFCALLVLAPIYARAQQRDDPAARMRALRAWRADSLEGYLTPETYFLNSDGLRWEYPALWASLDRFYRPREQYWN